MKKFLIQNEEEILKDIKEATTGGNLSSRLLLQWAFDIAKGMQYLARMHIMHGDLAARNILIGTGMSVCRYIHIYIYTHVIFSKFCFFKFSQRWWNRCSKTGCKDIRFRPFKNILWQHSLQKAETILRSLEMDGIRISSNWRSHNYIWCLELWCCIMGNFLTWERAIHEQRFRRHVGST